jgi:hypothetical protein
MARRVRDHWDAWRMRVTVPALTRAKALLRSQFGGEADRRGYVNSPQDNLIAGARLDQFEADLRRGDGNELRMKFCALHSSSALAVNCFAPFKERPYDLDLIGHRGAVSLEFERQLAILPGRRPANLDVWVAMKGATVAIESKFLEYFTPKVPAFAPAYESLAPPQSETSWWRAYQAAKDGEAQYLDRAQLIKHYFGLRRAQQDSPVSQDLTLLYLFWEPTNWAEVAECREHREQVESFATQVAGASVRFRWMTYLDLWAAWSALPELGGHVARLRARYELRI